MNVSELFRRLKWNERVRPGDFIEDERAGLKPWEGLTGFRAGTFVANVYRKKIRSGTEEGTAGACPNRD